jgi:predicted ATP-binding protein involved in virulence
MIRLNSLKLHNFRCFSDCDVSFQPDLTVLAARNGEGKTALLDAVALSLGLFVDTVAGSSRWRGFRKRDVRRIREGENTIAPPGYVQFEADAIVDGQNLSWRRWMRNDAKQERTSRSESKPLIGASQHIHDRLVAEDGGDSISIPLVVYYGTGRRWQENGAQFTRPTFTRSNERFLGYIDCLDSAASYRLFVDWYEMTFTSLAHHSPVVGTAKSSRPEFLLAAVNRAVDGVLEPETGWHGLRWNIKDRQLILQHPSHGELPLDFLSDGVRNTAALVADIAHRCARLNPHLDDAAKDTPGILLIDEIDLHLHPEWQQLIVEMLREAFPKLQLIVSTHSPQVLSTVFAHQIRVVQRIEGRLEVRRPMFQTRGVLSADVLNVIMGVDPVPRVPEALQLRTYQAMIEEGQYGIDEATLLRQDLLRHFGDQHPLMLECDRLIRFTEFKRNKNSGRRQ